MAPVVHEPTLDGERAHTRKKRYPFVGYALERIMSTIHHEQTPQTTVVWGGGAWMTGMLSIGPPEAPRLIACLTEGTLLL